jgi:putative thioredoxin
MTIIQEVSPIKDGSDEGFMADVIEASKEMPVIVDFWAPWCGPCKTLGPALEAEVNANSNKIKLVKIDIDQHPGVAGQLKVQSIPAVFAFSNGQPVDGFTGAQTIAQVKVFIKKILDGFGPQDNGLIGAIETAQEMLTNKNFTGAIEIFKAVIGEDKNLVEAHAGLIKGYLGEKDFVSAKAVIDQVPEAFKKDNSLKIAIAQIQIAELAQTAGNVTELRETAALSPDNYEVRFSLAMALMAEENYAEAIEILLQIIKTKPDWDDCKAKTQLIKLLDSLGPTNEEGKKGRRRLSSLIFA